MTATETAAPDAAQVTLAVLTGGGSRRMGRDKASLPVGGVALGSLPVRALAALCAEVLAVGAPIPGVTARTVPDAIAGAGPLSGLVAGLDAATTDLVVVSACDAPSIEAALVAGLLRRVCGDPSLDAALCRGPRGLEPLPAVWRRRAAIPLRRLLESGERALRSAVAAVSAAVVEEDEWRAWDPDGGSFVNWNVPADVAAGPTPAGLRPPPGAARS